MYVLSLKVSNQVGNKKGTELYNEIGERIANKCIQFENVPIKITWKPFTNAYYYCVVAKTVGDNAIEEHTQRMIQYLLVDIYDKCSKLLGNETRLDYKIVKKSFMQNMRMQNFIKNTF